MEDLFSMLLGMMGSYDDRKVNQTKVNGLFVSTAWTTDMGYETAILDKNGVHAVERYENEATAVFGHEKWCKEAQTLETITKLGWILPGTEEIITLKRH